MFRAYCSRDIYCSLMDSKSYFDLVSYRFSVIQENSVHYGEAPGLGNYAIALRREHATLSYTVVCDSLCLLQV